MDTNSCCARRNRPFSYAIILSVCWNTMPQWIAGPRFDDIIQFTILEENSWNTESIAAEVRCPRRCWQNGLSNDGCSWLWKWFLRNTLFESGTSIREHQTKWKWMLRDGFHAIFLGGYWGRWGEFAFIRSLIVHSTTNGIIWHLKMYSE